MALQSKKLTKLTEIFYDVPEENRENRISIDKLIPFQKHPFKLYTGSRLDDMVTSIKEFGILSPLLVRKRSNEKYEILSGHNRWNAAQIAGVDEVPVYILDVQNDDEAMLIVTESNLIQRSFGDLLPSERACVISEHHAALKNQGRRSDMINEIKNILTADKLGDRGASDLIDPKLNSRQEVGSDYDLSSGTVARYLRINMLSEKLKSFLDKSVIGLYVAVSISYLSSENQAYLAGFIDSGKAIDIEKAKKLQELQKDGKLNEVLMEKVLDGTYKPKKSKSILKGVKVNSSVMKKYFIEGQTEKDVLNIIDKALELFFSQQSNQSNNN